MNNIELNQCSFGCIDVNTGITQQGYIENGEMKFYPVRWWQKLFASPPKEIKYLGTTSLTRTNIFTSRVVKTEIAIYKSFNPLSGEIFEVWGEFNGEKLYLNIDAFKEGKLIQK